MSRGKEEGVAYGNGDARQHMTSSRASNGNSPGSLSRSSSSFSSTNQQAAQSQPDSRSYPGDFADEKADSNHAKAQVILDACNRQDIDDLKALAISPGGFLSDAIRRQAWPVLLGSTTPESSSGLHPPGLPDSAYNPGSIEAAAGDRSWKELPAHRDEHQIQLDVERSFIYYPNHQSQAELDIKKNELSDLIVETLRSYPYLCYFQGYHDICQVFLLVLPPPLRTAAVARLSALRIRDFMLPKLDPAISQLRLIPEILRAVDAALCHHLSQTEPFFALSGTLTMYAHDIQEYGDIARLFDALLAREQVFSVYMFAAIVLKRREELFDTPANEPEMLHSILSKLPQPLKLDELIAGTVELFEKHPPESLRSWRRVSSSSVLKTARDINICAAQTMDEGQFFFEKQLRELQWAEKKEKMAKRLRACRRPAKGVAIAILVGVAAVYLRRSPSAWALFTWFWPGKSY